MHYSVLIFGWHYLCRLLCNFWFLKLFQDSSSLLVFVLLYAQDFMWSSNLLNVKGPFVFETVFTLLKLVSDIFYQICTFHQLIALQKTWKMFFISPKKLFPFSRYSNFCISIFPSFSPCQPLPWRLIQDKSYSLWHHQLSKLGLNNTFYLISWEGKKVWH